MAVNVWYLGLDTHSVRGALRYDMCRLGYAVQMPAMRAKSWNERMLGKAGL